MKRGDHTPPKQRKLSLADARPHQNFISCSRGVCVRCLRAQSAYIYTCTRDANLPTQDKAHPRTHAQNYRVSSLNLNVYARYYPHTRSPYAHNTRELLEHAIKRVPFGGSSCQLSGTALPIVASLVRAWKTEALPRRHDTRSGEARIDRFGSRGWARRSWLRDAPLSRAYGLVALLPSQRGSLQPSPDDWAGKRGPRRSVGARASLSSSMRR